MIYNVIDMKVAKFDWGDETAIGDADWWAGLKTWVTTRASVDDRAACVGKKKLVSLSTAVLGANAATMVCIGADQDGDNTLAFQTAGTLPNKTQYGATPIWIGSTIRNVCQNFYNVCSARESIKIVNKGTCLEQTTGRNGIATYNEENVWVPSCTEWGLIPYSTSSLIGYYSTVDNSECTKGYNDAYSYNNTSDNRRKKIMNADGTFTNSSSYFWTRSRYYDNANRACSMSGSSVVSPPNLSTDEIYLAPAFVIG